MKRRNRLFAQLDSKFDFKLSFTCERNFRVLSQYGKFRWDSVQYVMRVHCDKVFWFVAVQSNCDRN